MRIPLSIIGEGVDANTEAIVEPIARATTDVVATVGVIEARPGAVNVIPGETSFTIDARAPVDAARDTVVDQIQRAIEEIAAQRGLKARVVTSHRVPVTIPWRWRRCVPSQCCSCAAPVGSATTRPKRSHSRMRTQQYAC